MSFPSPRPNLTNVVAACILSGGLIASAVINSRKPAPIVAPGMVAVSSGEGRAVLPTPPLSKEVITTQVVAQLMASPELQNVSANGTVNGFDSPLQKAGKSACKLMGVTVEQIEYYAKEDTFAVTINATFQPAPGQPAPGQPAPGQPAPGQPSSETPLLDRTILTLRNDGYNNYIDEYYLRATVNNATGAMPEVHLTVHLK